MTRCVKDKQRLSADAFNWSFSNASQTSVEGEAVLTEDRKFISAVASLRHNLQSKADWRKDRVQKEDILLTEVLIKNIFFIAICLLQFLGRFQNFHFFSFLGLSILSYFCKWYGAADLGVLKITVVELLFSCVTC